MSIERMGEWEYELICDVCGKTEVTNTFEEAVEYKKDNRWKSKRVKGEWVDICTDCQ